MYSPISSYRDGWLITGKQLVNKIREFKEDNKLKKNLNISKDNLIAKLSAEIKELKSQVESSDYNNTLNENMLISQTSMIEDLNTRIERQSRRLKEIEQSFYECQNSCSSKQATILNLTAKLEDAKKLMDDQSYAFEQFRKKTNDLKDEFEDIKKSLKERYLERLKQANKEMEEERDRMHRTLLETREFYDAEGNDYKRKIQKLTDELDFLRKSSFNVTKQPPARGRRRVATGATKDFSELKARRTRSASAKAKKQDITKPGCSKEATETSEPETIGGSKESPDKEEIRSLSPMEWLSPKHCRIEDDDDE